MENDYHIKALEEWFEKMDASTDPDFWGELVIEEQAELAKELADLLYVLTGLLVAQEKNGLSGAELELSKSRLWEIFTRCSMIIDADLIKKVFMQVHKSNMSKLGDDGKPIKNENGKVMKGPNYQPPDIKSVLMNAS